MNKKVTYNPKGLKRTDNILNKNCTPRKDLATNKISIIIEDNYWKVTKKKKL